MCRTNFELLATPLLHFNLSSNKGWKSTSFIGKLLIIRLQLKFCSFSVHYFSSLRYRNYETQDIQTEQTTK